MKKFWLILVLLLLASNGHCEEEDIPENVGYRAPPAPRTMLLNGSVSYSAPIKVPAGRAGITPALTISYNSFAKDGLLGHGWQLDGLGSIARSRLSGVDYKAHDFEIDGKELVAINTDNDGNGEYRAQINENFTRYEFNHDTGWVVTEKNGTKYYYGYGDNQNIESREDNEHGTFAWYLCRIEDPNGNDLTVGYTNDQGRLYPEQIDYTGNSTTGAPAAYHVRFHYQMREDVSVSYATRSKVVTAQRLMTVTVWYENSLGRAYKIDYDDTVNTPLKTSYLQAITEYGSDAQYDAEYRITGGTSLDPVKAAYTAVKSYKNSDFSVSSGSSVLPEVDNRGDNALPWKPLDYNGDGQTDLVTAFSRYLHLYQLNGASFEATKNETVLPWLNGLRGDETQWRIYDFHPADFNGDGLTDILVYAERTEVSSSSCCPQEYKYKKVYKQVLCLSTGDDFDIIDVGINIGTYNTNLNYFSNKNVNDIRINYGDFNGDGKTDIYFSYNIFRITNMATNCYGSAQRYGWQIYLANGRGFQRVDHKEERNDTSCAFNEPVPLNGGALVSNYKVGDFNGDGRDDLIEHGRYNPSRGSQYRVEGYHIYYFTGKNFEKAYSDSWPSYKQGLVLGDYNGDGKTDLFIRSKNEGQLYLADGNGFVKSPSFIESLFYEQVFPGDFNGDGRTDLFSADRKVKDTVPGYRIYLSTGSEFELTINKNPAYRLQDYNILPGDFNGDNSFDILLTYFSDHDGRYVPSRTHLFLANIDTQQNLDQSLADLLGVLDNGLGGSHQFAYHPSSVYDNFNLAFVLPVVFHKTDFNGLGDAAVTGYDYFGGYYKNNKREFLGFKKVVTTLPKDRRIETFYHQDNGQDSAGVAAEPMSRAGISDRYADQDDSYYKKGKIISETANRTGSDTRISATHHKWDAIASADPSYFVCLGAITTEYYDAGNNTDPYLTTYQTNTYDALQGNLDEKTVSSSDQQTEAITTAYEYHNYGAWLWRLTKQTVTGSQTGQVRETNFGHDANGNLEYEEFWDNNPDTDDPKTEYTYYTNGNLETKTDANNNTTTYHYDDATDTFVSKIVYPQTGCGTANGCIDHEVEFIYNYLFGQLAEKRDKNGHWTYYHYDAFGRLNKVDHPDGGQTITHYNDQDRPRFTLVQVKANAPDDTADTFIDTYTFYDGLNRKIETIEPSADSAHTVVTQWHYDSMGRNDQIQGPFFSNTTSYVPFEERYFPYQYTQFDERDRPTSIQTSDAALGLITTTYAYSGLSTTIADPDGARKKETRDYLGRIVTVNEYLGDDPDGPLQTLTTTYAYNAADDLLHVKNHVWNTTGDDNHKKSFTYDGLGRKITMSDPDLGDWQYAYDGNGNLINQTDDKKQVIAFSYDALNRLTLKHYVNTADADVTHTYDVAENGIGRLHAIANAKVRTVYDAYDPMGRPKQVTKAITGAAEYRTAFIYDLAGRTAATVHPDGFYVNNTFHEGTNLLYRIQGGPGPDDMNEFAEIDEYGANGKIVNILYGNMAQTNYAYDPQSTRLTAMQTSDADDKLLQKRAYQYTKAGDIKQIEDVMRAVKYNYQYDTLHRLRSEIPEIATGADTAATLQIIESAYHDPDHVHAVSNVTLNGAAFDYHYDPNGNMLNGPDLTDPYNPASRDISYNADNMPTRITHSEKGVTDIVYDGESRRTKKTTGKKTTLYISNEFEIINGVQTTYVFAGNLRIAKRTASGITFFHKDHLGSSTVMTNDDGTQAIETTEYLPYGSDRLHTGTVVSDYKFTDQELDKESGLYNYDARLYDPIVGRFVSADSTVPDWYAPQALNRYSYGLNNPLRYNDPDGHFPIETIPDFFSIGYSLFSLVADPSWRNAGYLAWDVGAAVLPYVPGSYVSKAAKVGSKVVRRAGKAGKQSGKLLKTTLKKTARPLANESGEVVLKKASKGARHAPIEYTKPGEKFVRLGNKPENLKFTFENPGGTQKGTYAFPEETFNKIGKDPAKLKDLGDLPGAKPNYYRVLEPPAGTPIQRGTVPGGEFGGSGGVPEVLFPEGF